MISPLFLLVYHFFYKFLFFAAKVASFFYKINYNVIKKGGNLLFDKFKQSKLFFWSLEALVLVTLVFVLSKVNFLFAPIGTFFLLYLHQY